LRSERLSYTGHFPNLRDVDLATWTWETCRLRCSGLRVGLAQQWSWCGQGARDDSRCAGYWEGDRFIGTWDQLEVEAIHDGVTVTYNGDPLRVLPVLRVRGRYRDFAMLETPTLGILTRASRVATNVYLTFVAARGKPVLFFPRALTRTRFRRQTAMLTILPSNASTRTLAASLARSSRLTHKATGGAGPGRHGGARGPRVLLWRHRRCHARFAATRPPSIRALRW